MFKRIFFILALTVSCAVTAQNNRLDYTLKLTISEGLAHNGVTSILEDSRGFLWFGTYDGISKYDGYKLKTYKNTIDNNLLTSSRVRDLKEDGKGNLWIGTEEGITIYDYTLNKFTKLYSSKLKGTGNEGPIIKQIIIENNLRLILCATEKEGILVFSEDYDFLGKYKPDEFAHRDILFFNGIHLNGSDFLFSSSNGLFLFDTETKTFKHILKYKIRRSNYIERLNENTLIAAVGSGMAIIAIEKPEQKTFKLRTRVLYGLRLRTLLVDTLDNLWLGTFNNGIIKISNANTLSDKEWETVKKRRFNDGLGVLRSSCFLTTSKNSCWYATFNEGVYQFNMEDTPFKEYNIGMNLPLGFPSNNTSQITALDNDRFYVSSPYGGMSLFNTKTRSFEPLQSQLLNSLSSKVSSVFVDSRKNIWIRLYGETQIYRIKHGSSTLEKLASIENFVSIRSYTEDKYGNVWIGTNNDVYRISINEENEVKKVEKLNNNPFFTNSKLTLARRVYADPLYDFIWIGADSDGLLRVAYDNNAPIEDLKVSQFTKEEHNASSISSDFVTSIVRLPNKELWLGTEGGGICKVINSNVSPKFVAYTEKNGLSNNVVKNILYDADYNLWVATNIGLNTFNTKAFSFRKFHKSDGLPFEDFWFISEQMDNGVLVLSGLDGFCYFNPRDVSKHEALPHLEFENFKIFNKVIHPGDTIGNRVLLEKSISGLKEITLKYNENVFSLDVPSLHFSNPKNHFIKYKLAPINNEWVIVPSNQNTISYNGLPPGEYGLSVMASNALNEWTPPKNIKIVIDPPFWRTNLAYLLYVLLLAFVIYMISRVVLKIQALNHKVEIEQLEVDNIKKVNEAKLRFFSNISHEIKTPLTLISGPLNLLLERFKTNSDLVEKLGLMQRQSKKIYQLIEQVQDFRKADKNLLKMNYSRFSFNAFMDEFMEDFSFFAKNDQKKLEIIGESATIIVAADKDKLEKIFNNLINNAFKYTRTNDTITVTYKYDDKDVIVKVKDTGIGIDSIDLSHIFERFYQSHKKEHVHLGGSGIGLAFSKRLVEMHYGYITAESELGVGTEITVRLPIVKQITKQKELPEKQIKLPQEKEVAVTSNFIEKTDLSDIRVTGEFSEALIFYVEDNMEMRTFVSNLLSKYFKVKSFRNGQECLDAFEEEWPDIVISDIQMPILNGLDLCVKIKSDLKTSHIPVILLTALTNIEDHLRGIRDGADAYIKKPFNAHQLITRTEALLINRKQLRERYQIGVPLTRENINNKNDNAFLDKLYSLMEENLDNQNFDLNTLAKELYLNRTHFYQKVKMLTDYTPFELLKHYRLKKASELLAQNKWTVTEVFSMTGFKSRTHFAKIFKEKYGVSPSKYASELLKTYES